MRKTKLVKPKSVKVVLNESFICDFCGKREKANSCYWWGGVEMKFDAGYGSNQDGLKLTLDICDECFKWKFSKFLKEE